MRIERPFTGRSNLYAGQAGVLVIDVDAIVAVNAVDELITLATLPAWRAVQEGEMIGTVKIIPFAVPEDLLERAVAAGGAAGSLSVAPFHAWRVGVISTLLPGLKPSVVRKTVTALQHRLDLARATCCRRFGDAPPRGTLADALSQLAGQDLDMIVVFGASAITDRRDVIPGAIKAAGR